METFSIKDDPAVVEFCNLVQVAKAIWVAKGGDDEAAAVARASDYGNAAVEILVQPSANVPSTKAVATALLWSEASDHTFIARAEERAHGDASAPAWGPVHAFADKQADLWCTLVGMAT